MVRYLIIGIIVAIVETVMALVDLRKYELTIYDIWPWLKDMNRVFTVLTFAFILIGLTIMWPVQLYVWIRRIVTHDKVQETGEDLA